MSLRIILIGKQGAGKGTQARLLGDRYSIPHISTGDVFRAEIASGSELGYRVKAVIDGGHLVSDELTNEVVRVRLSQPDVADGFLFDGYPRTMPQVEGLTEMLLPNSIDLVIDLDVPTEEVIERLASRRVCKNGHIYGARRMPRNPLVCDVCGAEVIQRDDDKPDAIQKRLAIYDEQTSPILNYYREQGKVISVDGTGTADEVFSRLVTTIDESVASRSSSSS